MSGPSFDAKRNPRLFKREWDHEHYLHVDPWPAYLAESTKLQSSRSSRRITSDIKDSIARDMKGEQLSVIWVSGHLYARRKSLLL